MAGKVLECGLRSLGYMASKVKGSLSSRSLKVYHLGLALVIEVRWWKLQCGALALVGGWCWLSLGLSSWAGRTAHPTFCFLLQMADCGGLPQVVQVRHTLTLPWHLSGTEPFVLFALKLPSLFPQPGKLTEAFKYFVQGMGYSKWRTRFCGLEQGFVKGAQAFWSI